MIIADRTDVEANEALRTHFQQLTEKFLVPLNRYFQTLIPYPASSNVTTTSQSSSYTSSIKPFSLPAFLTHLRSTGPNPLAFKTKGLTMKSRVENDFYASFGMSPTFAGWLSGRIESLGLAVRAQSASTSTSTVNLPNVPSSIGDRNRNGSTTGAGESDSERGRFSSEAGSSVSGWRDSEETPRRNTVVPGDVFGPRRASEA